MTAEKTVEQTRADYLAECVEAVAQRLRRLADDCDRTANKIRQMPTGAHTGYAEAVGDLQNDLMWMIGNCNLGSLTTRAADTDRDRLTGATDVSDR